MNAPPVQTQNASANNLLVSSARCVMLYASITNGGSTPRQYALIDTATLPVPGSSSGFTGVGDALVSPIIQPSGVWQPLPIDSIFGLSRTRGLVFQAFALGLTITGATNPASPNPIVISTSVAHGLQNGAPVTLLGVGGNTAANGSFTAAVLSSTTFALYNGNLPIVGNGAYTSGGVVQPGGVPNVFYGSVSDATASVNFWVAPLQ